jgi:hypothetical protein
MFCSIPCEKIFYASFEHVRHSPEAFITPLIEFFELKQPESIQVPGFLILSLITLFQALETNFRSFANKNKGLKSYPLFPQSECGSTKKEKACYDLVRLNHLLAPPPSFSLPDGTQVQSVLLSATRPVASLLCQWKEYRELT